MNKVFRVIWHSATQSWIVVSELSKSKGKTHSKNLAKITALGVVMSGLCGGVMAATAEIISADMPSSSSQNIFMSSVGIEKVTAESEGMEAPKNIIIIGNQTKNIYDENIMIGNQFTTQRTPNDGFQNGKAGDTVIGNRIRLGSAQSGQDAFGTIVGYGAQIAGPNVVIGVGARADVNDSSGVDAVANAGIAIGDFASIGGNRDGGTAIGAIAQADQNSSVAIGQLSGATRQYYYRKVTGDGGGGAVYNTNESTGDRLTSLGYKAGARGESSIAVGNNATTSRMGAHTLSFGTNSTSIKDNSIALGHDSVAGGYTKGNINELIGLLEKFETNPTDDNALIKAQKDMELARQTMKANASAENKFHYASAKAGVERIQLMIERLKNDLSRLSVTDSDTTNSIALGNQASARNKSAIAMGDNTESLGEYAFAATSGSKAYGNGSIALGHNATAGVLDSSISDYKKARDDYGSALNSYTGVLKELNDLEHNTQSTFLQTIGDLFKNATEEQQKKLTELKIKESDFYDMNAVSGKNITATELESFMTSAKEAANKAIETLNTGRADYKTKIETAKKALDEALQKERDAYKALATSENAIALGTNAKVSGENSIMLGAQKENAELVTKNSVVLGANSSQVIGGVSANQDGSGLQDYDKGTLSGASHAVTAVKEASVRTSLGSVIGYSGFAGAVQNSGQYVSIGSVGNERQIKNLAAGAIDATSTDAINGSQLYAVMTKMADPQQPVVYTDKDGKKVVNIDGEFYPEGSVKLADGKVYPEGTTLNSDNKPVKDGKEVSPQDKLKKDEITASMNNGNNNVTNPMALGNIQNNLPNVNDETEVITKPDGSTVALTPNHANINKAPLAAADAAKIANGTSGHNAATMSDLLNAGFNLQGNGSAVDFVKPFDTLNFIDGGNTAVTVESREKNTANDVRVNVVGLPIANTVTVKGEEMPLVKVGDVYYLTDKDGKPDTTKDPYRVIDGKIYAPDQLTKNEKDGTYTINKGENPTALHVNLVNPNAENSAKNPVNQVNNATQLGNVAAGANTFNVDESGNSLKQAKDGNYYPADKVGADGSLAAGVTEKDAKQPVTLANDGKWYSADQVSDNGTPKDNAKAVSVKNPGNAGLIDFANSKPTNAATVKDLQNLGWVISAESETGATDKTKPYADQVRNASKVNFKGANGIEVTGKTTEDGMREITVAIKDGVVTNNAEITTKDGKTIDAVKVDGKYYAKDENGKATGEAIAVDEKSGNTVTKDEGSRVVTGNAVATAIQESGWNLGLADKAATDKAFAEGDKLSATALEKVNPDDNVRFADGKGTKVSAATVKEVNEDGKQVTNTYVKVDIDNGEIGLVKDNSGTFTGAVSGPVTEVLKKAVEAAKTDETAAQDAVAKAKAAYDKEQTADNKTAFEAATKVLDTAKATLANANNAVTSAGNQVATAQNVADAINGAGWKTGSATAAGAKEVLITPSHSVNFDAGSNLIAKQNVDENNNVTYTYETKPDVNFNSVQLGGETGPKITGIVAKAAEGDRPAQPAALNVNNAKITGVADGDISPTSTDAVNGSQLYAITGGNKTTMGDITINGGDIVKVPTTSDGKTPLLKTYNAEGRNEVITNSVYEAIHNMNEQGIKYFHVNDDSMVRKEKTNTIDSSASGRFAAAIGRQANASGDNAIAMGHESQALKENTIAIGTANYVNAAKSGAFGDPNIINGRTLANDAYVSGSYAIGNDNVINSSNTFVLGHNVNNSGQKDADGKWIAAGQSVENSVYLGNETTATAGGDDKKQQSFHNLMKDGKTKGKTTSGGATGIVNKATVGGLTYGEFAGSRSYGVVSVGSSGNERRIQNVAAGEISATSTDAINGSQLYSASKALNNHINKVGKRADAGTASALAAAQLPQAYIPGKSMVSMGAGSYQGQSGFALGVSRVSDNGKIIIRLSGTANTQGKTGIAAGVGYQW